jgi:hypothetical protein
MAKNREGFFASWLPDVFFAAHILTCSYLHKIERERERRMLSIIAVVFKLPSYAYEDVTKKV